MASPDRQSLGSSDPDSLSTLNLSSEEQLEDGQGCNRSAVGSKRAASNSTSLSSHSSMGGSVTRVRKRKARDAGRPHHAVGVAMPPIRMLSADNESDFRDIVHQFTGKPSTPPSPKLPFLAAESQRKALIAAAITQTMKTLHIISSYLVLHGSCQDNIMMLSEINKSKSLALLKVLVHSQLHGSGGTCSEMATNNPALSPSICGGGGDLVHNLFASQLHNNPNNILNMNMGGNQGLPPINLLGMQQYSHQSQQAAQLESFLLKGNDQMQSSFSLA